MNYLNEMKMSSDKRKCRYCWLHALDCLPGSWTAQIWTHSAVLPTSKKKSVWSSSKMFGFPNWQPTNDGEKVSAGWAAAKLMHLRCSSSFIRAGWKFITLKEKKKTLFCFGFTGKWLDPAQLIINNKNTHSDIDSFRENLSFLCHSAVLNHICREIQKQ